MKKKILIGSIIAVALLTLVSFSSVVGYQSVKSDIDISVEENKKEIVYQEKSSEDDCGCDEDEGSDLGWNFPTICLLLVPLVTLSIFYILAAQQTALGHILVFIGTPFNCFWLVRLKKML